MQNFFQAIGGTRWFSDCNMLFLVSLCTSTFLIVYFTSSWLQCDNNMLQNTVAFQQCFCSKSVTDGHSVLKYKLFDIIIYRTDWNHLLEKIINNAKTTLHLLSDSDYTAEHVGTI